MVQPIAQPFSEKYGNDEVTSLSSGLPNGTSKSTFKVHSRSLNKQVPCICWTCGSDLDTDYYWAQVNSMSKIRKCIKFGGPTIRALQCCGPCLRGIYDRYSASRDSDYALPVFCLAPVEVSVPEEDSSREAQVHRSSLSGLDRPSSEHAYQLANKGFAPHAQRSARDLQRTSKIDREGNILLDRDADEPAPIRRGVSRPH